MRKYSNEIVFEKIQKILKEILVNAGLPEYDIKADNSLIRDLGFTSLMFIDLAVALEESFEFGPFPLQQWIDEQELSESEEVRVFSLVRKCEELLS